MHLIAPIPKGLGPPVREAGPVRVCFIIDQLGLAGTESQLLALVRLLDRSRVEPFLCLLDGSDPTSRSLEPADCPVLRLGLKGLLRRDTVAAAVRLAKFLRGKRVDVLQTYFLDSTYFGVLVARLTGIRSIVRVRNNLGYWLTAKHRLLGRLMGRLSHWTLTNSESGRQALIDAEKIPATKVIVLENGVDLERYADHPPPDTSQGEVRIGAVANLRPVKNIDGLIRAAASLKSRWPGLHFQVAGDGPQRPELDGLIDRSGLKGSFELLGSVSDIPGFLGRQDVAVLPSHSEGMSNALLEYMASGRAIVATDVGANSRLISHGVHGMLVPPGDDNALARAIARLLESPDLARRLAARARDRAEADFGRAAMCRRFEDFYRQLVGRGQAVRMS